MHPYIIGETAYHHEGDFNYLGKMLNDIAEIELNAVKYHLLLKAESYLQKNHPLLAATRKATFSPQQWDDILARSKQLGLDIIALCDDIESIQYIKQEHPYLSGIELHATSLNDYYMLNEAAGFPNRIILGVGGSTIDEIDYAVDLLRQRGKNDMLLMYGFQSYPTDYSNINLAKMLKLQAIFDVPVGYADHTGYDDENNVYISAMAAAMGINILEKHYTPDMGIARIDYHSAVGKKEMKKIKQLMEIYLSAYGNGRLSMSQEEIAYGSTGPMKKAIVARKKIMKGEQLSLQNLWFKRTEREAALKQKEFLTLIGLRAQRDIDEDEIIDYTKVEYQYKKPGLADLTGGLEAGK